MVRKLIPAIAIIISLASCASLKPIAFTNNKQAPALVGSNNREVKFLDNISDANEPENVSKEIKTAKKETNSSPGISPAFKSAGVEKASSVQFKYALLLNTNVEQVQNIPLYQNIDEWYGTRYKLGGSTKNGIDCSAFVQTIFISAFGVTLPRTAKEQYKASRKISRTELQEGDLLFFNTRGDISHVGIYLQNNKFVHASVSGGVTITDMFEPYYVKHFISAGRVNRTDNAVLKP